MREPFEAAALGETPGAFRITERDAQGRIAPAAVRAEYFPVHYVEPMVGNEEALGFDLASNPDRRAALEYARDTGEITATGPIHLVQKKTAQDSLGFLVLRPIYRAGAPHGAVEERQKGLLGFALGVFHMSRLIAPLRRIHEARGLDLRILDETTPENAQILYGQASSSAAPLGSWQWQTALDVGGRRWSVTYLATSPSSEVEVHWRSWTVLVSWLLFTGLLAGYLHTLSGRASAERLAAATAIKVSEVLSREVTPERLLETLVGIIMEHAGARRCCLLVSGNDGVSMLAEAKIGAKGLEIQVPHPGHDPRLPALPASLISHVQSSGEKVLLSGTAAREGFAADEYMARTKLESVLCMPITRQGGSGGVLYLEDHAIKGAFVEPNIALLQLLGAVSIENATLYTRLARENEERKQAEADLRDKLRIIEEQREAIRRLSTPVIEVWQDVLMMPVVGMIDAPRAGQMMDVMLEAISRTGCRYTVLDLTSVEKVDNETADHMVRLLRAVELLGAKGVVVGIRPDVARAIVSLGVDVTGLRMLSNLREGLRWCMGDQKLERR